MQVGNLNDYHLIFFDFKEEILCKHFCQVQVLKKVLNG